MRPSAGVALFLLILFGVAIRLLHLQGPPLDHHWLRQYDTAAIARNFAEPGSSILLPRVNWGGASPGYVESEFPLYQYLTGMLYRAFGIHESIPRLFSIFWYVLGSLVLFAFCRDEFDRPSAFMAVFFYAVLPLSWFFNRSIQPDAMAATTSLAAIHFFARWSRALGPWNLVLSGLALLVALLVKPTNLVLGLPLAYLAFRRHGVRGLIRVELWAYALIVLGAVIAWYWHAHQLWKTYGNTLYGAYPTRDLPADPIRHTFDFLKTFCALVATPFALPFLGVGMLAIRRDRGIVPLLWLVSYLVPVYLISDQFRGHDYYKLPLLLPMSCFMGQGFVLLRDSALAARPLLHAALVMVVIYTAAFHPLWFRDEPWHHHRVAFGRKVESLTSRDDRLITVKRPTVRKGWFQRTMPDGTQLDYEPVDLYLADRNGWCIDTTMFSLDFVERLRSLGATHLSYFVDPGWNLALHDRPPIEPELRKRYQLLYSGPDGALFDLRHGAAH